MKKSPTELMNLSFSILMIILTLAGAIIFAFTDLFEDRAYGNKRIILAVVFFSYCVYRCYRTYQVLKQTNE